MRKLKWIGLAAALATALTTGVLTLSWFDVLPGGWTLRGWVVPHAERRARAQAEFSAARVRLFEAENADLPADTIVFLGSSTIERFPLATEFPGAPCVDRGIGDETATELLARLPASLPERRPAGAVVYAGSLDFRRESQPPQVTARRVAAVLDGLREPFPDLPLVLIGILPERDMPAAMVARLAATNAALAGLAAARGAAFVPTDRAPITAPTGSLEAEFAADRLHLNAAGYRFLARWLVEDGGELGALLGAGR